MIERSTAPAADQATVFMASPHVGCVHLGPSHVIVTHVLGRRRLIGSLAISATIERFQGGAATDVDNETPEFHALMRCNIIGAKHDGDDALVRFAYGGQAGIAFVSPLPTLLPVGLAQNRPDAAHEQLFLSEAVALLPLDHGGVLATHPAGIATHLSSDLWELAQTFRRGRRPHADERDAAAFLIGRRILWPDLNQEAAACVEAFGLDRTNLPSLYAAERLCDIFRQISPAFSVAHVNRANTRKRIALIGPCIAQLFADSLAYHGYDLGWAIETESMYVPEARLTDFRPDLVVLPAGQFTTGFVRFALDRQWNACEDLVGRIVSICEERIAATRSFTEAPIAIAAVSAPALHTLTPASADAYRLQALFAKLNVEIAALADRTPNVIMIDEMDARERLRICPYWDDCYNSSAHRAPLTSWATVNVALEDHAPARAGAAVDSASAMTLSVLEAFLRLDRTRIDTIVFEPRGLLWPASYGWSERDRATRRRCMVDFVDFWSAGIGEALAEMPRRGIGLVCLSDRPEAENRTAMLELTEELIALRPRDITEFITSDDKASAIRALAERSGEDSHILWIDFVLAKAKAPSQVIFLGRERKRHLRETLLRSPFLSAPGHVEATKAQPLQRSMPGTRELDASLSDAAAHQVHQTLLKVLGSETRLPHSALESLKHLADAGIDSLAFWRVVAQMEETLGVTLDNWEREDRDAYLLSTLEDMFMRALLRAGGAAKGR